ncbi:hypothetical protein [Natronococcus occultus]|uniref:C2H2-type domain-containing protein n=1 Tax=Natronococcus occultus SP4 TaxID=694430 RepID=L0K0U6_9EURY|nr:hypothetical protein [Natronococcus occultus]AGB38626.1 hypothetical protein Natoc_2868 [Natronococcus occultus SP4]
MTDYDCPLCSEEYEGRTELRVHLEVKHRKSEIVSSFIDSAVGRSSGGDERTLEDDRPAAPL